MFIGTLWTLIAWIHARKTALKMPRYEGEHGNRWLSSEGCWCIDRGSCRYQKFSIPSRPEQVVQ